MTERPILFSGEMVRAILADRKTQTRRVIKPQPYFSPIRGHSGYWYPPISSKKKKHYANIDHFKNGLPLDFCPYGKPGDRLWVRETWDFRPMPDRVCIVGYRADGTTKAVHVPDSTNPKIRKGWRPSIYMPRWASRITLEITGVRVERVQDISDRGASNDCTGEGVFHCGIDLPGDWKDRGFRSIEKCAFGNLWDSINKKRGYGWEVNPWVWVIEFERVR